MKNQKRTRVRDRASSTPAGPRPSKRKARARHRAEHRGACPCHVLQAVAKRVVDARLTNDQMVLLTSTTLLEFVFEHGWRLWVEPRVGRDYEPRLLSEPAVGWQDPATIDRLVGLLTYDDDEDEVAS